MHTWLALIRGINVGGRNKLPMTTLSRILEQAGCVAVRTYIQSGNVVFASPSKSKKALVKRLGEAIETEFKFRPGILLLSAADFHAAVPNNPFPHAVENPQSLHFFFLESPPKSADLAGIAKLAASSERYGLIDTVFYLHAPDGIGRSKLAAGVERKLGVAVTARNYATVQKLAEMLAG
ncbi:MAG: DUF1697 domain-containing protein [Planctomycetaceae bacterium]|nr:DUF1697 domain-containing protein [Planctomycetaceae bacterium]